MPYGYIVIHFTRAYGDEKLNVAPACGTEKLAGGIPTRGFAMSEGKGKL